MKRTKTFITIAIISLLVQLALPVWWVSVAASYFFFWNEGMIEGSFTTLPFWGNVLAFVFSIYSLLALVVSIWSFFSKDKKRNFIFLIINILTILLAIIAIIWNGGVIPRF